MASGCLLMPFFQLRVLQYSFDILEDRTSTILWANMVYVDGHLTWPSFSLVNIRDMILQHVFLLFSLYSVSCLYFHCFISNNWMFFVSNVSEQTSILYVVLCIFHTMLAHIKLDSNKVTIVYAIGIYIYITSVC